VDLLEDETDYWYVSEILRGGDLEEKLKKMKTFDENSTA